MNKKIASSHHFLLFASLLFEFGLRAAFLLEDFAFVFAPVVAHFHDEFSTARRRFAQPLEGAGLKVVELAPGVTFDALQAKTGAKLIQ